MKNSTVSTIKKVCLSIAFIFATIGLSNKANAQAHPAYLHALSDLRAAKWMLTHRAGDLHVTVYENNAIQQINNAINDIANAAARDGKNPNGFTPTDPGSGQNGRLHSALNFLKEARQDISQDEDNAFANGLQGRSFKHIDAAVNFVQHSISSANY